MRMIFESGQDIVSYMNQAENAPLARGLFDVTQDAVHSGYGYFANFARKTQPYYSYAFGKIYTGPDRYRLMFKPNSATAKTDTNTGIIDIANGGVYYETECTECDVISYKNSTAGQRFSICMNDDVTVIIYGTSIDSKTAYLYYDNLYQSVGTELQTYITTAKALGAGIADKYTAQPIVLGGISTPLYSIVSNTTSADPDLFTEVVINGQKFFIVDYGIGVKSGEKEEPEDYNKLTVTENGVYIPEFGKKGYDEVYVNVKGSGESGFEMPRLNVYGYNIIDGRTWQVLNNAYGGIRPTPAGQSGWLTLDPTQSYEIGVAIKALTISGHLLVYSGDGAGWSQTPFCEYSGGQLVFYIDSNGGDPWDVLISPMESDNWPAMQANQWYFFKFAYDGNGKYTGAYTSDFDTWYTFERTSSITHYRFNTFGYGNGTLYSKSDIIYDIGNLYVKQNDQMIWGNYMQEFPKDT